jgi:hypothetical protein
MYSNNAGIVTIIEVTRGDVIKQFWEASPAEQKNPSFWQGIWLAI